jgi:hypothetical protein
MGSSCSVDEYNTNFLNDGGMRMNCSWMRSTLLAAMLALGFSGLAVAGNALKDGQADEGEYHRGLFGRVRPGPRKSIKNIGCYAHFNDYSCSSIHSETQFLFGSCRTFFGEACLKSPPPSPIPGFDLHALGLDKARCGCP